MKKRQPRDAASVAAAMRVPSYSHVYAIVPGRGPVTFHSQQRRAFNLLWALAETREVAPHTRVGIIGGGLAGMTAASAAAMLRCDVSVMDAGSLPFHQQRGCTTRYIHPNILDWPTPHALTRTTTLPHMNWTADVCSNVIDQVEQQLSTIPTIKLIPGVTVTRIIQTDSETRVTLSPYDLILFDCVISCVDWARKICRWYGRVLYWKDDDLHQFDFKKHPEVLITGTGDGGLIDMMRLLIDGFDHKNVWETVAAHPPLRALVPAIEEAETAARAIADLNEAGSSL